MAKPVSPLTRQRQSRAQLTLKQMRFVKEYAHLGNGSEAARRAGYKNGPRVGQIAVENLQKPAIKSALKRELAQMDVQITSGRVQRRLDEISHASQEAGQFGPAVRAEELLGKSIGMWIDQIDTALRCVERQSHRSAARGRRRKRQQEPIDLADDGDGNEKQDSNDE